MSNFTFVLAFPSSEVQQSSTDGLKSAGHSSMSFFLTSPSRFVAIMGEAVIGDFLGHSNHVVLNFKPLVPCLPPPCSQDGPCTEKKGQKISMFYKCVFSKAAFPIWVLLPHAQEANPHTESGHLFYLQFCREASAGWPTCKASMTDYHNFSLF